MYETGQLVRIRERVWEVVEDRTSGGGDDRLLLVSGVDEDNRGKKNTFLYRPGTEKANNQGSGIEYIFPEPVPELQWRPYTLPSHWERLHTAYRLSIAYHADSLLSLSRARLVIEPYQLEPVLRIMQAPRQRFLLAEDVGMGKTVEAGLVMMELIARGRADRILIVVPASLQDQWSDELYDKFGLQFQIIDNEALMKDILPGLPPGANPWNYSNHVITSIDFAKRERILRSLRKSYWDLVIIDEAHYLSESGTVLKPVRTERSRFGEIIATTSENLLLLTATPHNGYAQGFYSLLRLLDDTRFASPEHLDRKSVQEVMIRRSKNDIYERDGITRKFIKRKVEHIPIQITDPGMKAEKQLYRALIRYANSQWQAAGQHKTQRVIVGFAMTTLKKRFISSPEAIRLSLKMRENKLSNEQEQLESIYSQLKSSLKGLQQTEREKAREHEIAMSQTISRDKDSLKRELQEIGRLRHLAEQITPEKDFKSATLKERLDKFREQGRKVIVFTEYRDTLNYLYQYLSERGYAGHLVTLHGEMSRAERIAAEHRFHERDAHVLLATDAASEGLNFQRGCWTVIHNELPWNPNRLEQRNGRVDRWGQTQQVEIFNMVLEGTLESYILKRLAEKLEAIRDDIGKVSDVLRTVNPLSLAEEMHLEDLDLRLMEADHELGDEPTQEAFAEMAALLDEELDARLEEAKRQQREWLARMSIAQQHFSTEQYQEMDEYKRQTELLLPRSEQVEEFCLSTLKIQGGRAEPVNAEEHIWHLEVPPSLRRENVKATYERATFSAEVARKHLERRSSPNYLEYISLGHPLLESFIALVKVDARQDSGQLAGRMAPRVLADDAQGFLFTFLGRWQDGRGRVVAEEIVPFFLPLASAADLTSEQAMAEAERLLKLTPLPRNVPPALPDERYKPHWLELRTRASELAQTWCQQHAEEVHAARLPQMDILESDLQTWATVRESWVEQQLEGRLVQEIQEDQLSLFNYQELQRKQDTAKARARNELARERKIIENRKTERRKQIVEMKQIMASVPEMLGALVIVPVKEL